MLYIVCVLLNISYLDELSACSSQRTGQFHEAIIHNSKNLTKTGTIPESNATMFNFT